VVYALCFVLAMFCTLAISVAIGFMKWAILQVGASVFVTMFLLFMGILVLALVMPEDDDDE
jgi:hypothetical protein